MSDTYARDRLAILNAWRALKDGEPPELHLSRSDSRDVWSLLLAKEADNAGDVGRLSKMRSEAAGPLALVLDLFLQERREGTTVARKTFLENWRPIESPWGWLWDIETELVRRTHHGVMGDLVASRAAGERALDLALAQDWPGYVCSSSYPLVWLAYQARDHFGARRYLELFKQNADRVGARYYQAFYLETRAYFDFFDGDFAHMLQLTRAAKNNLSLSLGSDQMTRAELQALARLGRAREFRAVFETLRAGRRLNQRNWTSPEAQHLAIELLDLLILEGDLAEAERTIRVTRLFAHVCCAARLRMQTLRLELLEPTNSGRFAREQKEFWQPDDYEHDELLGRLFKLQFEFRRTGMVAEDEAVALHYTIDGSPYAYVRFLSRRFEMDRLIARGELRQAFQLCRALLEGDYEKALLTVVARRLAQALHATVPRGVLSPSALEREHGKSFAARWSTLWPYHSIGQAPVALVWDQRRSVLSLNGQEIPLKPLSPLAKFVAALARSEGRVVSYARLAKAVWDESYRHEYHDKKIQALVFSFKSLVEGAHIDPSFLTNVYGRGYVLSSPKTFAHAPDPVREWTAEWKTGDEVSTKSLQDRLGFNARRAQREIKKLVETGRLEVLGGRRNRRYRIVS